MHKEIRKSKRRSLVDKMRRRRFWNQEGNMCVINGEQRIEEEKEEEEEEKKKEKRLTVMLMFTLGWGGRSN